MNKGHDMDREQGEKLFTEGLARAVDGVGADIYARLVAARMKGTESNLFVQAPSNDELRMLADVALSAAIIWGHERHKEIEPCPDRDNA
jgi:poly(A) polymerase Pap1